MEPLITAQLWFLSVLALGFLGRSSTGIAVLPLLLTLVSLLCIEESIPENFSLKNYRKKFLKPQMSIFECSKNIS